MAVVTCVPGVLALARERPARSALTRPIGRSGAGRVRVDDAAHVEQGQQQGEQTGQHRGDDPQPGPPQQRTDAGPAFARPRPGVRPARPLAGSVSGGAGAFARTAAPAAAGAAGRAVVVRVPAVGVHASPGVRGARPGRRVRVRRSGQDRGFAGRPAADAPTGRQAACPPAGRRGGPHPPLLPSAGGTAGGPPPRHRPADPPSRAGRMPVTPRGNVFSVPVASPRIRPSACGRDAEGRRAPCPCLRSTALPPPRPCPEPPRPARPSRLRPPPTSAGRPRRRRGPPHPTRPPLPSPRPGPSRAPTGPRRLTALSSPGPGEDPRRPSPGGRRAAARPPPPAGRPRTARARPRPRPPARRRPLRPVRRPGSSPPLRTAPPHRRAPSARPVRPPSPAAPGWSWRCCRCC